MSILLSLKKETPAETFSCTISAGSLYIIKGGNGSGKTSVVRLLREAFLHRKSSHSVVIPSRFVLSTEVFSSPPIVIPTIAPSWGTIEQFFNARSFLSLLTQEEQSSSSPKRRLYKEGEELLARSPGGIALSALATSATEALRQGFTKAVVNNEFHSLEEVAPEISCEVLILKTKQWNQKLAQECEELAGQLQSKEMYLRPLSLDKSVLINVSLENVQEESSLNKIGSFKELLKKHATPPLIRQLLTELSFLGLEHFSFSDSCSSLTMDERCLLGLAKAHWISLPPSLFLIDTDCTPQLTSEVLARYLRKLEDEQHTVLLFTREALSFPQAVHWNLESDSVFSGSDSIERGLFDNVSSLVIQLEEEYVKNSSLARRRAPPESERRVFELLPIITPLSEYFASLPEAKIQGLSPKNFHPATKDGKRCQYCAEEEQQGRENFCSYCLGTRISSELSAIRARGMSIQELLSLSAGEFLENGPSLPRVRKILTQVVQGQLGHIALSTPYYRLSEGEKTLLMMLLGFSAQAPFFLTPSRTLERKMQIFFLSQLRTLAELKEQVTVVDTFFSLYLNQHLEIL